MATDILKQIWPEWQVEGKPLGKGSFGVVYKAVRRDHNVESYAAIKVISIPSDPSEVDSLRSEGLDMNATRTYLQGIVNDFVSEIQLMESLKGVQNIVSVEDYKVVEKADEIGWDIYIRMELLTSFNSYICDKKLTEEEVIKLGCDICTALEICDQCNIIHRDIKPENIFINDFGHFKLGDFGIARKMENITGGLSQKGSPNYMAPEVANNKDYDVRVDTYSLGIVLFRLLNGNRLPFLATEKQLLNPNERKAALDRRLRGEELPAPCDASPAMANLILRACAYDPNMRFTSATEMKQALMSVANGTYQVTDAGNLDKTASMRRAPADYDRTTSVRKAPTAPNQNSSQSVNTFGITPEKGNKLPVVIAAVLAIVILVGAGVFIVPKLISSDNGDNSSKISGEISGEPTSESADYSPLDEEQINSIIFEAEAFAVDEDYKGALAKIKMGLATYPKSETLQEKETEYTNALTAQIKATTLEEAANLAEVGDYIGAAQKIGEASAVIGDDLELNSKAQEYEDNYVSTIVTDIEEYLEVNDFSSAEGTLTTALALFPANRTLFAEKEIVKNAMPQSLLNVCPPYKTENCEEWTNLSMGGTKYVAGVSIGRTGFWGGEGHALFNLGGKFRILTFDVGNIDDRGSAANEALYIYLDGRLAWSLDLDPEALPTHYEVDVSGAKQMKIVGTTWAGDFGITNMVITGAINMTDPPLISSDDGEMLLSVCPPYKTENFEEWSHLSIAGTKYASGISIGRTGSWGGEGYALFNLREKYTMLSFDVGNIDNRGSAANEALYIYIDNNLIWSLDLNPEALPTHYVVDVSGANQMKIVGSTWAGDFGIVNLKIK